MINIALFGLGRIGLMHGKNLMRNRSFKLKYVYDINKSLTKKIAKKLKSTPINKPSIAFNDKKIEAVFIASTTSTHIKLILKAVKNKKAVFCEKPLDLKIEKINKCKKKISKLNPKIQLGFNRRYDPGHNFLKKELNKDRIGKLEKIIITSRDPAPPSIKYLKQSGGIFRDMMIHDFDLLRFYLGKDEVKSIFASASNISDKKFKKIKDFELASCLINSKKGVQCIITNSRHCSFGYDQRVEVFGCKGMSISNNQTPSSVEYFNESETFSKEPILNFFIERYSQAYKDQFKDFVQSIKLNKDTNVTFKDGRNALILANAANESLNKGQNIKINYD